MTLLTPLVTMALVVAGDQITKAWIMARFALYESREVIPGFFNLTYLTNTGVAFGMFSGSQGSARLIFFSALVVAALAVLYITFRSLRDHGLIFGITIGLIGGGAVGNIIDRFRFGAVVDFLDFYLAGYHWPAFNVADSAITVGVILFFFAYQGVEMEGQGQKEKTWRSSSGT